MNNFLGDGILGRVLYSIEKVKCRNFDSTKKTHFRNRLRLHSEFVTNMPEFSGRNNAWAKLLGDIGEYAYSNLRIITTEVQNQLKDNQKNFLKGQVSPE